MTPREVYVQRPGVTISIGGLAFPRETDSFPSRARRDDPDGTTGRTWNDRAGDDLSTEGELAIVRNREIFEIF